MIPEEDYDPDTMTLAPLDGHAPPGHRLIQCNCGITLNDAERDKEWPHLYKSRNP